MAIRTARNGSVEIAYETFGPPDGIPLILLAGSAQQMVMWPTDLCTALTERGFQVTRLDHRDSGLSTRLTQYDDRPWYRRKRAYDIRDMADDVIAVVDALGRRRACLLGASLGATVAQVAAVHHPDRVAALTLLSATPGSRPLRVIRPNLRTLARIVKVMHGQAPDADAEGQRWVDLLRVIGSPAYPIDEAHWRTAARLAHQRGTYAQRSARHTAAFVAVGDLRPRLARIAVPTLVVHGEADPMASWRAGKATADAIPGARFLLLPGVGHDLPREVWPTVLDAITAELRPKSAEPR